MATAYNATPDQTDDTPDVCACEDKIRLGIIAISRDPEKSGLTRGKEVLIEGIGKVVVMDRIHYRKRNQIDLYMENYKDAVEFGVKDLTISRTEDPHTGARPSEPVVANADVLANSGPNPAPPPSPTRNLPPCCFSVSA